MLMISHPHETGHVHVDLHGPEVTHSSPKFDISGEISKHWLKMDK